MDNKKLVPYIEYQGEKYEFVATRFARVKFSDMQKKDSATVAIGLKLNRLNEKIKSLKNEIEVAKKNSNSKPNDSDLYAIYKNYEKELSETESESDLLLAQTIGNGIEEKQIAQARDIAFELLKEKYGIAKSQYDDIIKDFEEREGKEIVDEFMLAMVEIVFTQPEVAQKTENEFLKAYRAKRGY